MKRYRQRLILASWTVFEINVFQCLSRGTFNGFSHGMCVNRGTIMVCELVSSQISSEKTGRTSHITVTPKAACLEKKDVEKERRHAKKCFIAAGVSVRERKKKKNSDARLTFSAASSPKMRSNESLHQSYLCSHISYIY